MTRFARASGSKGSNEKRPEEASSWQEIKATLSGKSPQLQSDKQNVDDIPSVEEIQSVWCDLIGESENTKKAKKIKDQKIHHDSVSGKKEKKGTKMSVDEGIESAKKPKKRKAAFPEESDCTTKKQKKIKLNFTEDMESAKDDTKKEKFNKSPDKKKKKMKGTATTEDTNQHGASNPENPATEKIDNPGQTRDKKRRKEPLKSSSVIINGQVVKVAPFDGFMIQADDALRLTNLRKDMKNKGIPRAQIEAALKMERRRAEKALAKLRKQVCFHCRGSGHNLSDCPELKSDRQASGICYKCGSTEHTHFQCKVNRKGDFPYAECFVCKEQGHIARQCPDNPRGLYPRGGGCALCLDVTHLKKDCPKYLTQKADELITVGSRNDRSLEGLEDDEVRRKNPSSLGNVKTNKHIRF